jgi:hypothetical protein
MNSARSPSPCPHHYSEHLDYHETAFHLKAFRVAANTIPEIKEIPLGFPSSVICTFANRRLLPSRMLSSGFQTLDKTACFYPYSSGCTSLLKRNSSEFHLSTTNPRLLLSPPHILNFEGSSNTVDGLRSFNFRLSVPSWSGVAEVAFTLFHSNPNFL